MFDSYSFDAETARRLFSCLTCYPVKSRDQVSLVFPSHLKDPGSITATLLRGESLRTFPNNTSALNKTCFVAHQALLHNAQQFFDNCCYRNIQPPMLIGNETHEESRSALLTSWMFISLFVGFIAKMAALLHDHPCLYLALTALDAE